MIKKSIYFLLTFLIIVAAVLGFYFFNAIDKLKTTTIPKENVNLGISNKTEEKLEKYNEISNFALFGLDRRKKEDPSRSDCIMIVSLDGMHNKIKISSIMRDTYVQVPKHNMTKIAHAYAYGGGELAVRTINENFNLNIKDFVSVDFFNLEKIINIMGGVKINIRPEEIKYINKYSKEISYIEKVPVNEITSSGTQILNGNQAVAYARIRSTADGDFERAQRQRTVLSALVYKFKELDKKDLVIKINYMLPYIETSMNKIDIFKYTKIFLTSGINTVDEERFPLDKYCSGKMINGTWYLKTDLSTTSKQISDYIFEDIKPQKN